MKKNYFGWINFEDPSLISLASPSYPKLPVLIFPLTTTSRYLGKRWFVNITGTSILLIINPRTWCGWRRKFSNQAKARNYHPGRLVLGAFCVNSRTVSTLKFRIQNRNRPRSFTITESRLLPLPSIPKLSISVGQRGFLLLGVEKLYPFQTPKVRPTIVTRLLRSMSPVMRIPIWLRATLPGIVRLVLWRGLFRGTTLMIFREKGGYVVWLRCVHNLHSLDYLPCLYWHTCVYLSSLHVHLSMLRDVCLK